MAATDLKQWLQQPLFDFTSGEVPFNAALRIANGSTTLQIDSDLLGASIDLPTPFHKTAEQGMPLSISMELNEQPNLTATLSDWADMRLRWNRTETGTLQLGAGVVRLGQRGKNDLHEGLLVVTGAVESTNLSEWGDAMHARPTATQEENHENNRSLAVQIRELQFNRAQIGRQWLDRLTLSGRRDSAAWSVQMRADQIAGVLTLPDDTQQPWRAQLNYLRIPVPDASLTPSQIAPDSTQSQAQPTGTPSQLSDIDPRNISALDLRIDHLWRGDEDMGWVETQIRPIEHGVRLDQLKGHLRGVKILPRDDQAAHMDWIRDDENHRSKFVGRLAVDDIATALQRWRYEPVLTSKQGHVDIDVQWPDRPDQFKFVQTNGKAALRFEDGQFKRASNSATGALKVVGIFNFANFLRRLQFDFSDIYKEGLSFDEMQGSFKTENGVLAIEEPVEIKSPSSRFRVAGEINFNNDQANMELVATLPVASNLPWVAALTGALPAAAGLYVASKVFEDQFDKFSSATYEVSGPWADPQVKLRRVFDDQLPQKNESVKKKNDAARQKAAPERSNNETPAAEATP